MDPGKLVADNRHVLHGSEASRLENTAAPQLNFARAQLEREPRVRRNSSTLPPSS
jgi:hypothetical protein